jgi:hypothetical protein
MPERFTRIIVPETGKGRVPQAEGIAVARKAHMSDKPDRNAALKKKRLRARDQAFTVESTGLYATQGRSRRRSARRGQERNRTSKSPWMEAASESGGPHSSTLRQQSLLETFAVDQRSGPTPTAGSR